jgi:MFS family permease
MAEERGARRLFRSRSYRLLWIGSTTSNLGAAVTTVALAWVVFSSTQSTIAVTLLGLANFVPGICIGLAAGVLADRFERRQLMLRADLARVAATAALVALLLLYRFELAAVLAIVVVVSAFSALFRPAANAIIPELVAGEDRGDANGLLLAGATAGNFLGAAVGGLCVVTIGAAAGFTLNSLTYAVSAAMLFLLVVPRGARPTGAPSPAPGAASGAPTKRSSFTRELAEGFSYVRSQPALLYTILSSLAANFFIAFYFQYIVIFVSVGLHGSASLYGIATALSSVGFGVGALLVGRFRLTRWTGWVYILGWGLGGLLVVALGLFPSDALLLVVSMGFSAVAGLANTAYFATVQRIVPGHLLGRFFAIDEVTSFAILPLGQIVGGLVILTLGIDRAYVISGLGSSISILALLFSRSSRNLSDRAPTPPAAVGVLGPPAPPSPSPDGAALAATFLAPP